MCGAETDAQVDALQSVRRSRHGLNFRLTLALQNLPSRSKSRTPPHSLSSLEAHLSFPDEKETAYFAPPPLIRAHCIAGKPVPNNSMLIGDVFRPGGGDSILVLGCLGVTGLLLHSAGLKAQSVTSSSFGLAKDLPFPLSLKKGRRETER